MRLTSLISSHALIVCLSLATAFTHASDYDQLIMQARAGEHAAVLAWLDRQPELTLSEKLDYLTVSNWAGRDESLIAFYRRHQGALAAQSQARELYARSLRNLQQWTAALDEYSQLLTESPERDDLRHALIMTQADAGELADARQDSASWVTRAPDNASAQLARAYVFMRAGEHHAALRHYDLARQLAPGDAETLREYLLGLQRAGLPVAALQHDTEPSALTPAERRSLQADHLAELVTLSGTRTRQQRERYQLADRALELADELLAAWAEDLQARADAGRVRVDRLGALHARQRMADLKKDAEILLAAGVELPAYARRWYASALLQTRQPAAAADIYQQLAGATNPRDDTWLSDNRSLFYALIESNQLDAADRLAIQLAEEQPAYLELAGTGQRVANEGWVETQTLLANAHVYLDRLPQAERQFVELSDAAPGNSGLRVSRASTYQIRGWPRRAEAELKLAENSTPLSTVVLAGQADNAFTLREWRAADELTDHLAAHYPETLASQRTVQRQELQRMRELQVNAWRSQANGGEAFGSGGYGVESLLYSAPLADNWRVFTGLGYATGSFPEGNGQLRWQRLGADWRMRDHWISADISNNNYNHGNRPGFTLTASHDLDDHWQYGWQLEWGSREIPLRALQSDISGDSQSAYLRWRANERREWRLGASRLAYEDGNTALGLSIGGRERLHTQPRWHLEANLDAATGRNSKPGEGPYFSPDRDITLLPSLTLNHTLYQHYDIRWSQRLQAGVGGYQQRSAGSHAIAVLAYGQRLQLTPAIETGFSLSLGSRPYDGQREQQWRLDYDLGWRF